MCCEMRKPKKPGGGGHMSARAKKKKVKQKKKTAARERQWDLASVDVVAATPKTQSPSNPFHSAFVTPTRPDPLGGMAGAQDERGVLCAVCRVPCIGDIVCSCSFKRGEE